MSSRRPKRPAQSSADELAHLTTQLYALIADVSQKTVSDIHAAADAADAEATILDLGVTSAQGISLKGRVLRELEAELTTFELLKQPLKVVVEAIDVSRRDGVGAIIPSLGAPPADSAAADPVVQPS